MVRIFVTGGAGYIGSHVCKVLSEYGFEAVAFDNLSTGHRELVKWGPLIEGDVDDRDSVESAIREVRPAAVLHFATSSGMGSPTLLEAMVAAGVSRIVLSSTCATYGVPATDADLRRYAAKSDHTYGRTKLVIERMIDAFERAHGTKSVCLRYFNACGPIPEGRRESCTTVNHT